MRYGQDVSFAAIIRRATSPRNLGLRSRFSDARPISQIMRASKGASHARRARLGALLGAAIALSAALVVVPVAARAGEPEPYRPLVLGFATWDRPDLFDFQAEAGEPPAMFQVFFALENPWPPPWLDNTLDDLELLGMVMYAEITSNDLAALNSGAQDAQLAAITQTLAQWLLGGGDRHLVVAPLPEANITSHPWGGDPAAYQAGYLRIRQAFLDAGLGPQHVRFVFSMNGLSGSGLSYPDFYPGDAVVDIVGFSKINRNGSQWRDYEITFGTHIREMQETVTLSKPILITQTGSVDNASGDRTEWLEDMFTNLLAESQVIGVNYFNRDKFESGQQNDYRVLIDGVLDPAFETGYNTWSQPSELSWIFDGSMDAWVADRAARYRFLDTVDHPFEAEILWIADQGITLGCGSIYFCPDDPVTREQMASFLSRALALPAPTGDYFSDDSDSVHEDNINRLAEAGVTFGCAPGIFCPGDIVTRDQMASFLVRALALPTASVDLFGDDEGSPHEDNINRLATSGITLGCGPGSYCPGDPVTRGQMAAFLHRALS